MAIAPSAASASSFAWKLSCDKEILGRAERIFNAETQLIKKLSRTYLKDKLSGTSLIDDCRSLWHVEET